jgi:hypothetical protein
MLFPRFVTHHVQIQIRAKDYRGTAELQSVEGKIKGRGTRGYLTACLHRVWYGAKPEWSRAAMLRRMASVRAFRRAVPH